MGRLDEHAARAGCAAGNVSRMRVLLVGPSLPFPWMAYTARALRRLGHTAVPFRYTRRWINRMAGLGAGRVPGVSPAAAWCAARWRAARDQALIDAARRMRPDLVLVLRGELIAPEALAQVKRHTAGPCVTWWVDDPDRYPGSMERLALYDHVFVFDRACVRRLAAAGLSRVDFLPCACDETIFRPATLSAAQRRRYGCEIALVGWYYPNRGEIVKALNGFQVGVWGRGWTRADARQALNGVRTRVLRSARYVSDDRAAAIYNAASIGLNVHHAQACEAGLNTRTFEVLAAGTFELIDAVPGMEELLAPGEEVVAYRSPFEARELAAYYLRQPRERARIAERGRARVLAEHTYVHRMRRLLHAAG